MCPCVTPTQGVLAMLANTTDTAKVATTLLGLVMLYREEYRFEPSPRMQRHIRDLDYATGGKFKR